MSIRQRCEEVELGALEHGEMAEAEQRLLRRLGWTGDGLIDAVDRG